MFDRHFLDGVDAAVPLEPRCTVFPMQATMCWKTQQIASCRSFVPVSRRGTLWRSVYERRSSRQASDLSSFLRGRGRSPCATGAYLCRRAQFASMNCDQQSELCARGLAALGIERGDRVALLVRPSQPLFVLTFGLLRRGAVPVLIDPGIGRVHLARCLAEAMAQRLHRGLCGARSARFAWLGERLRCARSVTVGAAVVFWGGASFERRDEGRRAGKATALPSPGSNELAAIAFTSGSTGTTERGGIYA